MYLKNSNNLKKTFWGAEPWNHDESCGLGLELKRYPVYNFNPEKQSTKSCQ